METPRDLSQETRVYFLKQGQSIKRLHEILASNILAHHLKKWLSLIIEIILYISFALSVMAAIWLPSQIEASVHLNADITLSGGYDNEELFIFIFLIKIIMVLLAFPLLLFAILLGRNRRKNNLIRKAFDEAVQMKQSFDKAISEFNF